MTNRFKRIGLWGRFYEDRLAEPARQLTRHLNQRGISVATTDDNDVLADAGEIQFLPGSELGSAIDLMVAIGGDGNLLRATRCVIGHSVPLIGINRGRLGFLTDVRPDQMLAVLDDVLDGEYLAEERLMLKASIVSEDGKTESFCALNDVVLQKSASGRILDFVTKVDGHYVNSHGGDGLIVATPTGSTAYALSCGGPIIRPDVQAMVMVPICPHTLSDRPLVLQSSSKITVTLPEGSDGSGFVTCDGEELGGIDASRTLEITAAPESLTLLHPGEYNYYELLRSKLNWGRANRSEN
jgi:NAD+ kinase